MSKKIGTPSVPTSKPEVLSGRRAMLSRTLVGVVGGLVQQQVTAKTIPPLEPDYVQGKAKVVIGEALIGTSDDELETIDPKNTGVGRARKLVEMALRAVLKTPSPGTFR